MIRLQVFTDGRKDCIERTIKSAIANLVGPITEYSIHDDSGDPSYRQWLEERFPDFSIDSAPKREGFTGAIGSAWREIRRNSNCFYIFHLEDDFTFNRRIDLLNVIRVLSMNPQLAQMAFRRQPWNDDERAAGGIVEQHPDNYTDCSDRDGDWLEHRVCFTTNPCLYRTHLIDSEWPQIKNSEGMFTHQLLREGLPWGVYGEAVRFGFWGKRESTPLVHHIGEHRVGTGY